MSTRGQFNTKNPTIKRILKEASELASNASADYHAEPLEDNLFEWHFTLRGPPVPSPYADGLYHGRIILPSAYPLRPPSFRFTTPSGRFEVNREICLSISGFHEETWQPAWGIRTALVAIRSFMDTGAQGQVGGLECSEGARKKMAAESVAYRCSACGKTNKEIMAERKAAARELEANGERKKEVVPDELKLAYREELGKNAEGDEQARETASAPPATSEPPSSQPLGQAPPASNPSPRPASSRTTPAAPAPAPTDYDDREAIPAWIDYSIYGVLLALLFMVFRNFIF